MSKTMKNIMVIVVFLAVFGLITNLSNQEHKEIKTLDYPSFKDKLEEVAKESESLVLLKSEAGRGRLLFTEENFLYETYVDPGDKETISTLYKTENVKHQYIKDVHWVEGLTNFVSILFLFIVALLIFMMLTSLNAQKGKGGGVGGALRGNKDKQLKKAEIPKLSFKEVGGLTPETKEELKQTIKMFKQREEAKEMGIDPQKGLLLHGPPGTGKTLIAKAIAHELGATFYSRSGSGFVEKFVGVGAERVRDMFEEARKNKPALIFIDEVDAVAGKRGDGHNSHPEREQTLNELLKELDGTDSNEGIFVIGATNRLDMLDDAFTRSGRFDNKTYIGLPDVEGRREIIDIHSKKKKLTDKLKAKLDNIAATTYRFTGADIESLFKMAGNHALMNNRLKIDVEDINYSIDRMALGNKGRHLSDKKVKERVAYHEAGHALLQSLARKGSIRKATIVPRGQALGFVAPIPKEMDLSTREELMSQLRMILAGGAAEIHQYGEHSIGVGGDVQQAKKLIDSMVEVGMVKNGFNLSFNKKEQEELKDQIYKEAIESCQSLIKTYEGYLEKIAHLLMEKETVDGSEVDAIVYGLETKEEVSVKDEEKEQKSEWIQKVVGEFERNKLKETKGNEEV